MNKFFILFFCLVFCIFFFFPDGSVADGTLKEGVKVNYMGESARDHWKKLKQTLKDTFVMKKDRSSGVKKMA